MDATDNELRLIVLQKYYEKRREGEFEWKAGDFSDVAIEFDWTDLCRICDQLADADLIDWHPLKGGDNKTLTGYGRISRRGVDVIEGKEESSMIKIDQSRHFNVGTAHHSIFGDGNVQISSVTVGQIAQTIDQSTATKEQKDQARSVLKRAFEHPIVNTLVGAAAQAAAKAFTGGA
jgi:hypothetical protein